VGIKDRVDRLGGRVKRCPVCNFPGPAPRDTQVDIVVSVVEVDFETGRAILTPPPEPQYCSGCGRELPVIRVKGIESKPVAGREEP
jgi:hypothetical protein